MLKISAHRFVKPFGDLGLWFFFINSHSKNEGGFLAPKTFFVHFFFVILPGEFDANVASPYERAVHLRFYHYLH